MQHLASDLRAGLRVDDERFDGLLAAAWQSASSLHWTPLQACWRAMQLLAPQRGERVLDVGSGVGKVCIVGALTTDATFVGVERRPHLVNQARLVARAVRAERATFICSDAFSIAWQEYHCLYLYNPFEELTVGRERRIDDSARKPGDGHRRAVNATQRHLSAMAAGTRVVTFDGFGGTMPDAYTLVSFEKVLEGLMALWIKEPG